MHKLFAKAAVTAALLGFALAPTARAADPMYFINFTDTNGDIGHLILDTATPVTPGGTVVDSITGMLDGESVDVVGNPHLFGSDQEIYASSHPVDYPGLGFDNSGGLDLNLYWTNPTHSGPGQLAICYVAGCNEDSGFYSLTSFSTNIPVPEPATWAMTLLGLGMIGFGLRTVARRKSAAALATA